MVYRTLRVLEFAFDQAPGFRFASPGVSLRVASQRSRTSLRYAPGHIHPRAPAANPAACARGFLGNKKSPDAGLSS